MQTGFSLKYDGQFVYGKDGLEAEKGLRIIRHEKRYAEFQAIEWVLEICNTGNTDTGMISDLHDCDIELPMSVDANHFAGDCLRDDCVAVYAMNGMRSGSDYHEDDFASAMEFRMRKKYIPEKRTITYQNSPTGRCSEGQIPLFDMNKGQEGYILFMGWSGDWTATFTRNAENVHVQTGMRKINLYLQPNESIRTTSILIMEYHEGREKACNQFRRLIRTLAPFGKGKHPQQPPLAFESFGGIPTNMILERFNALKKHGIHFDYHWMDAGWQGNSKIPCTNCYTGDWSMHTGEYCINKNYHPKELQDVVATGEKMGMRLMLWFEPERILACSPIVQEHPEYYLELPGADKSNPNRNVLLKLGDEKAWDFIYETLCYFIEKLHIGCYRQDFNIDPVSYWHNNDTENREGMTEIRHIMGLYRLWDALMERFPDLLIDDCAGGGRRIELETMRRAVPFCRSDFYCGFNAEPDVVQSHNSGISMYLPYSGAWTKIKADKYASRSAYSAAMGVSCWCADFQTMNDAELEILREIIDEYRDIRRFFFCDYYPIAVPELDTSAWTAWQYHSPEEDAGVVMAFRRDESPMESARFCLKGLNADVEYILYSRDKGEVSVMTGKEMSEIGVPVSINTKRDSRVIVYQKK